MDYLLISLVAFLTSGLTVFSGFGLGTLLLPAFVLFFPVGVAVALTAVVHFVNNLFKLLLFRRHAAWPIAFRFGLPALVSSWFGAQLLVTMSAMAPIATYHFLGAERTILPVKSLVAVLMVGFALFELLPAFSRVAVPRRYLPLGGLLSGFFGGLSGHQGALRSAFLINCGLSKEAFIGTGVVVACLVDVTRIAVYGAHFASAGLGAHGPLLAIATGAAWLGAWLSARFLTRVTMRSLELIVAGLLVVIAVGLASGLL